MVRADALGDTVHDDNHFNAERRKRAHAPRTTMTKTVTLLPLLALLASGCALRSTLKPVVGEARAILWRGAVLNGTGGAQVELAAHTPVVVKELPDGDCKVIAANQATVEGLVACSRLGFVAARPTPVLVKPEGPTRLVVNGGVLLAPKERKGDFVRVAGDGHETFEGWVRARDLAAKAESTWLAPGLTRYPWVCEDGGWLYDKPKGTYLLWIPGPWCRVSLLAEKDGWAQVRYEDQRMRAEGWVERSALEPDREPRFHPGAVARRTKGKATVYAKADSTTGFGHVEPGVRVWASIALRGRLLIQTQGLPNEVVGWVDPKDLE